MAEEPCWGFSWLHDIVARLRPQMRCFCFVSSNWRSLRSCFFSNKDECVQRGFDPLEVLTDPTLGTFDPFQELPTGSLTALWQPQGLICYSLKSKAWIFSLIKLYWPKICGQYFEDAICSLLSSRCWSLLQGFAPTQSIGEIQHWWIRSGIRSSQGCWMGLRSRLHADQIGKKQYFLTELLCAVGGHCDVETGKETQTQTVGTKFDGHYCSKCHCKM